MKRFMPVVWLLLSVARMEAASALYVSVQARQQIAILEIDDATGRLAPVRNLEVGEAPGAMAVSPDGRFLYVALHSTGSLGSFRIDETSGDLSAINAQNVGGFATYVATDRTGRHLLSAYYSKGKVEVHRLAADGAIAGRTEQIVTAKNAHCVLVDRSNRFVFVPHTGAEKIFQFIFDAGSGRLTANPAGHVDTADAGRPWEPRHLWFHPAQNLVFSSMERGNAIAAFRFDPKAGTLAPVIDREGHPVRASTLPADFNGANTNANIELTPDGRFAYVSNRGHDSIAGFAIDTETGGVRVIGVFPTERTPRSFNIHPSGRFLYAAGQASGNLAAYRILDDGRLELFQTLPVGDTPAWVQVVKLGTDG